jgi:DNA polymerase III delta prime subunit
MIDTTPWVIKYAPNSLDNMLLTDELRNTFNSLIENKTLNNMTLYGIQGSGKTTISKLLAKELNCEHVLFQSCSVDGSIDMVKTKIKDFCDLYTGKDKIKIIILDEADSLTQGAGNNAGAQMALRNIIAESLEDTRFILTCNYLDRIIPALQSRCTPIKLEFTIQDVAKHIVKILQKENIKFTKESLKIFVDNTVKRRFPDVRSIIEHLQISCQSGELQNLQSTSDVINDELIQFINDCNDVMQIRSYLMENEDKFSGDYISLAGKLFNYYTFNTDVLLCIADYLYKMQVVLDKEIQFTSMICMIKRISKEKQK